MSRIMSLLLVGQLWKNCTVTQNSWLKRKVGLFVLLVLSFDLCSLSPVVCLRSLTIYNVHISFVLLISNSVLHNSELEQGELEWGRNCLAMTGYGNFIYAHNQSCPANSGKESCRGIHHILCLLLRIEYEAFSVFCSDQIKSESL